MLSDEAIANLTRVLGQANANALIAQMELVEDLGEDTINTINSFFTEGEFANPDLSYEDLAAQPTLAIVPNDTLSAAFALLNAAFQNPDQTTQEISDFLDQRQLDPSVMSIRSLTSPTLGTLDPSKTRFSDLFDTTYESGLEAALNDPLYGLIDETEEWFIKEEIDELIGFLPDKERELISIELADFFGTGMDRIYRPDGKFNEANFQEQMYRAFIVIDAFKPTIPVFEDGDNINVAGQSGLGISTVFDIVTGQSGRTIGEIEELFDIGLTESGEQAGYKYYDPVYLMDTVNNKAGQLLGVELSEQQKQAFVRLMKDTVDAHFTGGLQMPMVDAQAKKFVQEEFPQRTLAEAQGSTIRAIEAAVRNM